MKYFYVYTQLSDLLSQCLQQSLFILKQDLDWERSKFDLAYIDEYTLEGEYPFGLIISSNKDLLVPDNMYECVSYKVQGQEYFVYYIYDVAPQFDNDWQLAYSGEGCLDYFVDTIYRYILREAIKENEEWCGHFSSALRKM